MSINKREWRYNNGKIAESDIIDITPLIEERN